MSQTLLQTVFGKGVSGAFGDSGCSSHHHTCIPDLALQRSHQLALCTVLSSKGLLQAVNRFGPKTPAHSQGRLLP